MYKSVYTRAYGIAVDVLYSNASLLKLRYKLLFVICYRDGSENFIEYVSAVTALQAI